MGKDTTAFRERFNAYKNGKSVSEIYDAGLPRYGGGKGDGTRYLHDELLNEWDRITNDEYARAFADLTVVPEKKGGNRQDIRTNPVYHDPRLKSAGYVTREMLEDEANSVKQHETGLYAPGLELVNPEFDLLFMGAGSRINPLTQQLHRTRGLAKQMNRVFDEGLVGATKDMPVLKASDMYNPEHFRSAVKYNPRQIEAVSDLPKNEVVSINNKPGESVNFTEEITVPEQIYTGPTPRLSTDILHLYQYKDLILETPSRYETPPLLPENNISKYVDSEGNINMRNVVKAVREFYNNHPEAINYKHLKNRNNYDENGNLIPYEESTLYKHIKAVVKSAQEAPVPEGYTRQQLVQSALFHDIGKVLDIGKTHDKKSVEIMNELGIETTPEVRTAIGRHMSSHLGNKDALSKALHFVDVARGYNMELAKKEFLYLGYPGIRNNKINPAYSKDTRWQLENIINPILERYGYSFSNKEYAKYGIKYVEGDPIIPLGVDDATARLMVLDKIRQHRTFVRSLYEANGHDWDNLRKQTAKQLGKNVKDVTNEDMFKNAALYIKIKDTNSNTMGLGSKTADRSYGYEDRFELNEKDFQALYNSNRDLTASGYTGGSKPGDGASYFLTMDINDDPNWSLAELWANNEFPIVYSSGGQVRYGTHWRNYELPYRLNTGLDLNKELDAINQDAKTFNRGERQRVEKEVLDGVELYFNEHPDELKDVFSYYGDTYPTKHRQVSYNPTGRGDIETWSLNNSDTKTTDFSATYDREAPFSKSSFLYNNRPNFSGVPSIVNFNPAKLKEFNDELKAYGIKEMLPSMSSTIKDKKLHINYANLFISLMDEVTSKYSAIGDFKNFINSTDADMVAYHRLWGDATIPRETVALGVDKDGEPIFGEDVAMSYINKITADSAKDVLNRLQVWGLISNKLYQAVIKNKDFYNNPRDVVNKYINIKGLYRAAINNYFKDVKLANKKDAFIRRSSVKEANDRHKDQVVGRVRDELRNEVEKARLKKEYSEEELMKAYGVEPDYSYMSPDGYRVFSTERLDEPDPSDISGNHYVVVGPRGSKLLNVLKSWDPTVLSNSHVHRGNRIRGTSRNLGSILYPVTIAGGTATLINNKNKKK